MPANLWTDGYRGDETKMILDANLILSEFKFVQLACQPFENLISVRPVRACLWGCGSQSRSGNRANFLMSEQFKKYNGYLQSDHWRSLREFKFDESGKLCAFCASDKNIHVHHIRYKNLTDCVTSDLCVLCQDCHDDFHFAAKFFVRPNREVEVKGICALIVEFRAHPKYTVRCARMIRRKQLRATRLKTPRPPRVPRSKSRMLLDCARRCRKEKCSRASIERLITVATNLLNQVEEVAEI